MTLILERRIKGSMSLEALAEVCGIVENMSVCKLIRITKKTDEPEGKFNLALFEKVALSDEIPKPEIVEAEDPQKVPEIIAEHLSEGKDFIYDATIYANDADVRSLGFR